jgi:hypothetical protein
MSFRLETFLVDDDSMVRSWVNAVLGQSESSSSARPRTRRKPAPSGAWRRAAQPAVVAAPVGR